MLFCWLFLGAKKEILKHLNFKNNTCPACFKTFNRKDHVHRHFQELHLKQVQYQCRKCMKKFKRRYLMDNHERNCNGLQVHQCWSCKNVYKTREYLLNHIRKVHALEYQQWGPSIIWILINYNSIFSYY